MKAIAAAAIAANLTQTQLVAAGFFVSIVVLVLALTGTLKVFHRLLPLPLIRGIQLGTGLQFVNKGVAALFASSGTVFAGYGYLDNYLVAFLAFSFSLLCWKLKRNPAALVMFLYGIAVSVGMVYGINRGAGVANLSLGPAFSKPLLPSADDFKTGILTAGLGQLPLTLLNSVIATSKLADDLFPNKNTPVASVTALGVSVGLMNIIGMWFGSVPYCHGSGGLAAQYRFGARSHVSVILLGIFKLAMGLTFGSVLLPIFQSFPQSILGVMLILAGIELGTAAKDVGGKDPGANDRFLVTLVVGSIVSAWANDGIGFAMGCVAAIALWISEKLEAGEGLELGNVARGVFYIVREEWRGDILSTKSCHDIYRSDP